MAWKGRRVIRSEYITKAGRGKKPDLLENYSLLIANSVRISD